MYHVVMVIMMMVMTMNDVMLMFVCVFFSCIHSFHLIVIVSRFMYTCLVNLCVVLFCVYIYFVSAHTTNVLCVHWFRVDVLEYIHNI